MHYLKSHRGEGWGFKTLRVYFVDYIRTTTADGQAVMCKRSLVYWVRVTQLFSCIFITVC